MLLDDAAPRLLTISPWACLEPNAFLNLAKMAALQHSCRSSACMEMYSKTVFPDLNVFRLEHLNLVAIKPHAQGHSLRVGSLVRVLGFRISSTGGSCRHTAQTLHEQAIFRLVVVVPIVLLIILVRRIPITIVITITATIRKMLVMTMIRVIVEVIVEIQQQKTAIVIIKTRIRILKIRRRIVVVVVAGVVVVVAVAVE